MAQKFRIGDRVQLKASLPSQSSYMSSYGLKPGDEGVVINQSYGTYTLDIFCSKQQNNQRLSFDVRNLDLVKVTSREKIKAKIESVKAEMEKQSGLIAELNAKIKYMDEIKSDTFDENEFKAYQTLTIIEKGSLSKLEKAKAIAALINQR